jgi:hypothetical protein
MNLISQILLKSLLIILVIFNFKTAITQTELDPEILTKIKFDINQISQEGLIGPLDGLRSITYEFCVPNQSKMMREVTQIDPTIQFFPKSPGRIGCQNNEVLALGNTHQSNWKEILINLANLDYIKTIQEYYGE